MKVMTKKSNAALGLVLSALAALLMLPGCAKKSEKAPVAAPVQETVEEDTPVEETVYEEPVAVADIPGVMITGWYYTKGSDKDGNAVMSYAFDALPGTIVKVYGEYDSDDENYGGEFMTALVDGVKKGFVHITYDGEDYWVRDYSVAVNAIPAIISSDGVYLYTKPNLTSMGQKTAEKGTICAMFQDDSLVDDEMMFRKIRYYVPDGKTYTVNGYLLTNSLDINETKVFIRMCQEKINSLNSGNTVDDSVIEELEDNIRLLKGFNER